MGPVPMVQEVWVKWDIFDQYPESYKSFGGKQFYYSKKTMHISDLGDLSAHYREAQWIGNYFPPHIPSCLWDELSPIIENKEKRKWERVGGRLVKA